MSQFNYNENVYWQAGDKKFNEKFAALKYATDNNFKVTFSFFDEIWNKFDKSTLGTRNLDDLYRIRAQQLRDEYDYLVLYFSGGADSYNVLRSFIDNKIKLDEVCVKWPMVVVDKELYTPNTEDKSAFNYVSEWDYAIKPVLDELKMSHPEIKIEIADWSIDFTPDVYNEENMKASGAWNDVEISYALAYSSTELRLADKGKKVASIYGIDKPIVASSDGKWFMGFSDSCVNIGLPFEHSQNTVEYFYWTPSMPEIVFEQAHKLCAYLELNPSIRKFFLSPDVAKWTTNDFCISNQVRNETIKAVVYSTWTNRFQVDKPLKHDRTDKQAWIFAHPELTEHRDAFIDINSEMLNQVKPEFRYVETSGFQVDSKIRGRFSQFNTKWHFVKFENLKIE